MSKRNRNNSSSTETAAEAPSAPKQYALPEGYEVQSDDVVGFWNPAAGPIHFIPKHCVLTDSQLDGAKPSVLVIGELVDPCELFGPSSDDSDEPVLVQGKPGDNVGVWAKAGMSKLRDLANVKVFMYESGEKDVGKRSPMKLYTIASRSAGDILPVSADRRKTSARAATSWSDKPAPTQRRKPAQEFGPDDDAPF